MPEPAETQTDNIAGCSTITPSRSLTRVTADTKRGPAAPVAASTASAKGAFPEAAEWTGA